ncbi:MAG: ACT domain-containing protein [Candidatus Aquicultorales bacterium]
MGVTQISVFLENREGRLAEMTKLLGDNGFNLRAIFVADTADYGIARIITERPDEAVATLKSDGYTVNRTEVLAVRLADEPGSLGRVLGLLNDAKLNVEYLYAFADPRANAGIVILRIEDTAGAYELFKKNGIETLEGVDIYK